MPDTMRDNQEAALTGEVSEAEGREVNSDR